MARRAISLDGVPDMPQESPLDPRRDTAPARKPRSESTFSVVGTFYEGDTAACDRFAPKDSYLRTCARCGGARSQHMPAAIGAWMRHVNGQFP